MLKTKRELINADLIYSILMEIIKTSYESLKGEEVLLCLDCLDVDLNIATYNNDEFAEAIKVNFELDENFEIIDYEAYRELMDELHEYFILMHTTSGLFDFFPEGEYEINGEIRIQESDHLAPTGVFAFPFEDGVIKK